MIQDITYTVQIQGVDLPALTEAICDCDEPFKIFGLPCTEWDRTSISGVCLETGDKLTVEVLENLLYVYEPLEQDDQFSKRFIATLQDYVAQVGGTVTVERNETKMQFEVVPLEGGFVWSIKGGDRHE